MVRSKSEQVTALMALFKSPPNRRGLFHPHNGSMETTKETITDAHWLAHLEGSTGLGIVPIDEQHMSWWGVIDVDAHEEDWFIDIPALALKVEEIGLPLVVCQSKSKGAHCYVFLQQPIPAVQLQKILQGWAAKLSSVTVIKSQSSGTVLQAALVEIFPKQKRLSKDQIGSWVNLPYFNARETIRFAYFSNRPLSLEEFIDLAENKRASRTQLYDSLTDYSEAPPCVERMLTEGVPIGSRNMGLFTIATYFKKAGVEDIDERLFAINYDGSIVPRPLAKGEVTTITKSVVKGNYQYRCNESPLCDMCNREVCVTRRFGVGEAGPSKAYDSAVFGGLKKVLSDPPRWDLEVNGLHLELTTEQLMDFRSVRKTMLEKIGIVAPPMKTEDWLVLMRVKNEQRTEVSAPDDASKGGIIGSLLTEFVRPAERLDENGKPRFGKKEDLLRGIPVVVKDSDTGEPFVYFRGVDFIQMLKRKRAEEFKGAELWSILRKCGCIHDKLRVGHNILQVWGVPFESNDIRFEVPEMKERF